MPESQWPNVIEVRSRARREWEVRQQKRRTVFEMLVHWSIPLGLFIIATVFYLLSAQHTSEIFNLLSPGMGNYAPIGIELGIVYTAFMAAEATTDLTLLTSAIKLLRRLLLVIVVIVNGAGSFITVVSNAGLSKLSTSDLLSQFSSLPAISQVALVLSALASLAIPTAAVVSGEGFFLFLSQNRKRQTTIDGKWEQHRAQIEYEALRDAAINQGITPGKAARWAGEIAQTGSTKPAALIPSHFSETGGETLRNDVKQPETQGETGKAKALRLISENPAYLTLSLDRLERETGIDRSTWYRAKLSAKDSSNGNGAHE